MEQFSRCPFNHAGKSDGKLPSFSSPLLSRADVEKLATVSARPSPETTALELTMNFLRGFVGRPHPHLGRAGHVCPFTEGALAKDLIRFQPYSGPLDGESLKKATLEVCDYLLKMEPVSGPDKFNKAILLIFATMKEEDYSKIDQVLMDTKNVISRNLMLGQLHPACDFPGLRNPDFRPLRSPVPMLIVRHVAPHDIIFKSRVLSAFHDYNQLFKVEDVPCGMKNFYDDAAERFGYPGSANEIPRRVFDVLLASEARYTVVVHGKDQTPHSTVATPIPTPPSGTDLFAKTTLLKCLESDALVLVVSPQNATVDTVAAQQRLRLHALTPANRDEVEPLTSQSFDALSPIGHTNVCVLVDDALLAHEYVLVGTGRSGQSLRIAPHDLCRVTDARVGSFNEKENRSLFSK